jgi:hypothetical protein
MRRDGRPFPSHDAQRRARPNGVRRVHSEAQPTHRYEYRAFAARIAASRSVSGALLRLTPSCLAMAQKRGECPSHGPHRSWQTAWAAS